MLVVIRMRSIWHKLSPGEDRQVSAICQDLCRRGTLAAGNGCGSIPVVPLGSLTWQVGSWVSGPVSEFGLCLDLGLPWLLRVVFFPSSDGKHWLRAASSFSHRLRRRFGKKVVNKIRQRLEGNNRGMPSSSVRVHATHDEMLRQGNYCDDINRPVQA